MSDTTVGKDRNPVDRAGQHYFFFGATGFAGAALASFLGAAALAFFLSLPWELLPFAMMLDLAVGDTSNVLAGSNVDLL